MGIKILSKKKLWMLFPTLEKLGWAKEFLDQIDVGCTKTELLLTHKQGAKVSIELLAGVPSDILSGKLKVDEVPEGDLYTNKAVDALGWLTSDLQQSTKTACDLSFDKAQNWGNPIEVVNADVVLKQKEVESSVKGDIPIPSVKKKAKAPQPVVLDLKECTTSEQSSLKKVKLKDAEMLYQPVFGTDTNSTYYVVGIAKDVKVAARWNSGSLSVRVEARTPKDSMFLKKLIGTSQMEVKSPEYASCHLSGVDDDVKCRRALGAMLLSLNDAFFSKIPDPARLKVTYNG